jgi:hypothetical protein
MPFYLFLEPFSESLYSHKIRTRPRWKFRGDTLPCNSSSLSTCEATDPRDKIYAGLGLLGGQRQEGVLASKPNYDVTAQALYTEFARCWILKRKL